MAAESFYFSLLGVTGGMLIAAVAVLIPKMQALRHLQHEKDAEHHARIEAETQAKLLQQEMTLLRREMSDWEKTKERHLEAAKASVLKAGSEISSKLLEDHKREAEAARKENERRVQETTERLHHQFKGVFESVKSLNDQVKESKDTVETVHRALLSPGGAGSLAEITLENVFRASGLIESQDYTMQYWMEAEGGGQKPDAFVNLPDNDFLIVDSKASKFFVELGSAATGSEEEKQLLAQLKKTMNAHLQELIKRNYREGLEAHLKKSGRAEKPNRITMLMFLPTETALDRLRKADQNFMDKAWKERILPVGPTGLVNILLHAKLFITNVRQEANHLVIIEEIKKLLGNVARLQDLSAGLGKNLKGALEKYDAFASSFNRHFLGKTRKLATLDITSRRQEPIQNLPRYHIYQDDQLVEGESEEVPERPELEKVF